MAINCAYSQGRHLCTKNVQRKLSTQIINTTIALCGLSDVVIGSCPRHSIKALTGTSKLVQAVQTQLDDLRIK
jgi:hypothetical protein